MDAADTHTPSWERRFRLCGGTHSSRSRCRQKTRDSWWEGQLNTGVSFGIAYPTRPKNQTRRFQRHQEPAVLGAPTNPTRSQDGGSPAVPLQPGEGWRLWLAALSHILITQRVIKYVARTDKTAPTLKLCACFRNAAWACQIEI